MEFRDWVLQHCGPPSRFLSIGNTIDIEGTLGKAGWEGLCVQSLSEMKQPGHWRPKKLQLIYGQMGPDPHFVPCMVEGASVKAITVEDIFDQFLYGKDWPVVLIFVEDQHRMVWSLLKDKLLREVEDRSVWLPELRRFHVKKVRPQLWIMPEDSHNEAVVAWGQANGYTCEVMKWAHWDVLVLHRSVR